MWSDMTDRCETIRRLIDKVEAKIPGMVEAYRTRLSARLSALLERVGSDLREEELRREIALYADRSDISEEIARLRAHLEMIDRVGARNEPSGRRLEFIPQEMFREVNTMASKAAEAEMAENILDIKGEVEKLREQSLNIE